MYRQGDVLLIPVDFLPLKEARQRVKKKKGEGVILAAGEATGHHHRVREPYVTEWVGINPAHGGRTGERFLSVGKYGGTITHEEHDPIPLPPNTVFKIVQQREYEPVIKDNTVRASSRAVYD